MLTLAAAQLVCSAADIQQNLSRHLRFMQVAAEQAVQLLVFPELSLTGYELEQAEELAIHADDERLLPLRNLARQAGMTTVIGAPLRQGDQLLIAALVFGSDGSLQVYGKQHLHGEEARIFTPGEGGGRLSVSGRQVALAVCADFTHASHPRQAAQAGADIYAASVLISEAGYATDSQLLAGYAAEHGMTVLLANHGGPTGGWQAAGRSALWDASGERVAEIPGAGNRLLVAQAGSGSWAARVVEVVVD